MKAVQKNWLLTLVNQALFEWKENNFLFELIENKKERKLEDNICDYNFLIIWNFEKNFSSISISNFSLFFPGQTKDLFLHCGLTLKMVGNFFFFFKFMII